MKRLHIYSSCQQPVWFAGVRAFTLTEMMVTMAVFALVVIAMVSLQIFGFKINSLTSNKQVSTANSLKVLDQIQNRIRGTPNPVFIGNFNTSNNKFTAIANGQSSIGNAVLVSNGAASVFTFYLNTNTHILYERGSVTNALAHDVTNSQPFQTEDCFGNLFIVGSSGHYTVKMTLQYSNWLYSIPTNVYDTYRLEARATPRSQ
ncbi:MAG: prepilin-type N-terminal cleavage/methylation domain-containing protein [Verrucomicrobiia bacterium]